MTTFINMFSSRFLETYLIINPFIKVNESRQFRMLIQMLIVMYIKNTNIIKIIIKKLILEYIYHIIITSTHLHNYIMCLMVATW